MVGLAALHGEVDIIFMDELAHFSLVNTAQISGLPIVSFAHADPNDLERLMKESLAAAQRPVVLTDSVFGATGRLAPLADYATLLAPVDGRLLVDESHAFGAMGPRGRGAADDAAPLAIVGSTLGKAFCAQGAVVALSHQRAQNARKRPPYSVRMWDLRFPLRWEPPRYVIWPNIPSAAKNCRAPQSA